MKILNRWNACIFESDHATQREAVITAVNRGADLRGVTLRDADLRDADLGAANLRGADLRDANLGAANLRDADLRDADLRGAIVAGCALGTQTFGEYLDEVVSALLTAGGVTLEAILAAGAWECNDWNNCPMAVAFGVHQVTDIPALHRPRAQQFITLFDSGQIPREVVERAIAKATVPS